MFTIGRPRILGRLYDNDDIYRPNERIPEICELRARSLAHSYEFNMAHLGVNRMRLYSSRRLNIIILS